MTAGDLEFSTLSAVYDRRYSNSKGAQQSPIVMQVQIKFEFTDPCC
jgi:hypothetical protein